MLYNLYLYSAKKEEEEGKTKKKRHAQKKCKIDEERNVMVRKK